MYVEDNFVQKENHPSYRNGARPVDEAIWLVAEWKTILGKVMVYGQ